MSQYHIRQMKVIYQKNQNQSHHVNHLVFSKSAIELINAVIYAVPNTFQNASALKIRGQLRHELFKEIAVEII